MRNAWGPFDRRALALFLGAGALLFSGAPFARAEDRPLLHRQEKELRSIDAVNVDVPMAVVTGTVTVRAGGVLVSPQQVTYAFQPEFPLSRGRLRKTADGTYVLKLRNVPANRTHTLTMNAVYNDTVVREGVVQRLGETRSGRLELAIPHGRDTFSFGEQLLDLH